MRGCHHAPRGPHTRGGENRAGGTPLFCASALRSGQPLPSAVARYDALASTRPPHSHDQIQQLDCEANPLAVTSEEQVSSAAIGDKVAYPVWISVEQREAVHRVSHSDAGEPPRQAKR